MNDSKPRENTRELVIPGEILNARHLKTGINTYRANGEVYSAVLGFKNIRADYINVIPLSGRYFPQVDDLVIGCVISLGPTTWLIDINSPYPAPLHVNEVPWRVDFGDTASYLDIGDAVLVRVSSVDEIKKIQVSMKSPQTRKLFGGHIFEISPSKVPRVIGKNGSMINLIKTSTNTKMFVGQNGRIWLDGETEGILKAIRAIKLIEKYSHKYGLTDRIARFLSEENGGLKKEENEEEIKDAEIL
ncbi:MAG TPA: RNA-binding protein [Thermoplasmata archaeon]|nr:RNA-binding protein [Thermoplasmata archaeon]